VVPAPARAHTNRPRSLLTIAGYHSKSAVASLGEQAIDITAVERINHSLGNIHSAVRVRMFSERADAHERAGLPAQASRVAADLGLAPEADMTGSL
jgi:hypothetical protein